MRVRGHCRLIAKLSKPSLQLLKGQVSGFGSGEISLELESNIMGPEGIEGGWPGMPGFFIEPSGGVSESSMKH